LALNTRWSTLAVVLASALLTIACAKKNPKALHTEPWLAHPPASARASADADAALPITRYALTAQSQIRFELSTKRGKVRGLLTGVKGELRIVLGALAQSRGELRAELATLALDDESAEAAVWLARAQTALGVGDAGAATPAPVAVFDVSALSDVSPDALEPARASDAGAPSTRRVRATAEGDLLLNGFRVSKRAPLEAEFGFSDNLAIPASVVIRSRAPLVVSLETHEIHLHDPAQNGAARRRNRLPAGPHDIRVSFELYGTKE
jgi:hypothetical protein